MNNRLTGLRVIVLSSAITVPAYPVYAETYTWICQDGEWNSNTCWGPAGFPHLELDTATVSDAVTITFNDPTHADISYLELTNDATLNLHGGQLHVSIAGQSFSGVGYIGRNRGSGSSIGVVSQTAGSHSFELMYLGFGNGSHGTYHLSGGNLSDVHAAPGQIPKLQIVRVGANDGVGVFNQTGGIHGFQASGLPPWYFYGNGQIVADVLNIDVIVGEKGTYNLSGGALAAKHEWIGPNYVGAPAGGIFTQTGGSSNVTNQLTIYNGGTYNFGDASNYELGSLIATTQGVSGTFNQTGGTNTSLTVFVSNGGNYNVNNGWVTSDRVYVGMSHANDQGVVNHTGGQVAINSSATSGLYIGGFANSTGQYNLSGNGTLIAVNEFVGYNSNGNFKHSAGSNTVSNELLIGNAGTYELSGGTVTAPSIVNNGHLDYSGGNLVANIENNNQITVSGIGTRTFTGNVTNNASATIKVTDTNVVFTGTFNNNGAYVSDPANNYFSDLTIGATGYLVGGTGDTFFVGNDFTNQSESSFWETTNARLVFNDGVDMSHAVSVGGHTRSETYAWGTFEVDAANSVDVNGQSIYVDTLVLGNNSNLTLDGVTFYYRTFTNNGGTIDFANGGQLLVWSNAPPVPELPTYLLMGGGLIFITVLKRKAVRR